LSLPPAAAPVFGLKKDWKGFLTTLGVPAVPAILSVLADLLGEAGEGLLSSFGFCEATNLAGFLEKMLATGAFSGDKETVSLVVLREEVALGEEVFSILVGDGDFFLTGELLSTGDFGLLTGSSSSSESLAITAFFLSLDLLGFFTGESLEFSVSSSCCSSLTAISGAVSGTGSAVSVVLSFFLSACNGVSGSDFRLNVFRARKKARKTSLQKICTSI
jgi:hypothetical protein